MAFKIKPILTPRQLRRSKFTLLMATVAIICLGIASRFVEAEDEKIKWNGEEWEAMAVESYPRGRIVYFSQNEEICTSAILIPGIAIMGTGFLATMYGCVLIYLFLGISIVADIFMEAIEKITSEKVMINIVKQDGDQYTKKVERWNKTVANLTLMALGSSAPEILLAVLETSTNLGKCPGELGASTIVGSAAFNLLVISAICIWAINPENDTDPERDMDTDDGVKKIYNMKVFAITCSSSLFAYIWLWIVLIDQ
jgi:hypothetical protein